MKLMIADEARDDFWTEDIIDVKREGESLVIVTLPRTFIVGPFKEFAEKVVDLYDDEA